MRHREQAFHAETLLVENHDYTAVQIGVDRIKCVLSEQTVCYSRVMVESGKSFSRNEKNGSNKGMVVMEKNWKSALIYIANLIFPLVL